MKRTIAIFTVLGLLMAGCGSKKQQKDYFQETSKDKTERMAWWKEARFGMFIHWGLYAIPAGRYKGLHVPSLGEWIMRNAQIPIPEYEKFAPRFNPIKFDAREWVRVAKDAGMKYIIITSKHHDGFGLWNSKISKWDVMDATPFKRDILKELADACAEEDMPLGFYYSIMDWHHPNAQAPFFPDYNDREKTNYRFGDYVDYYMKPQLKELIKGYGKLAVLWFDGQWVADWTDERGRDMYNFVRNLKPDILINNRVGSRPPHEPGMEQSIEIVGDFGTPEQSIPYTGIEGLDWESCITMNSTWGYKSDDDNWKPSTLLIKILVDIVSKGGNLLLNVGPMADGLFPKESVDRLAKMGDWLDVNGESIYGATASPFGAAEWGRYTQADKKIYAHVLFWPEDGKLNLLKPKKKISKIYALADKDKTPITYQTKAQELIFDIPKEAPDEADTVYVMALE